MIIKTNSHRCRDKVVGILGHHPQFYFKYHAEGSFLIVDDPVLLERLLKITGVSKPRDQVVANYRKCWSF